MLGVRPIHARFCKPSIRLVQTILRTRATIANMSEAAPTFKFSSSLTTLDTEAYDIQLAEKRKIVEAQFADFNPPCLEVFRSQPKNYRMRTEFTVWHEKDEVYYVMHEKDEESGERRRIRVETFPVASELINHLMHHVMTAVRSSHMLRHKLFQANFHTTLSGQAMITLIYHKKLDDAWTQEAKQLRAGLADVPGATTLPHVIGRSRKTRLLLDDGEVEEVLDVPGRGELKYVQVEGAFSQPNGGICRSMLGWAVDVTSGSQDHDLLELYCGNGNFTAAVAPNFRRVMATEVSKSAVAAARRNFESNGLSNVLVARMRSEEFVEAWRSGRKYQRLENTDLKTYDFKTLLVDPPRSGLDDETRLLAREFERIVYISCNPETLRRDVAALRDAFEVQRFAMFDQFPYTHHVECGVYLVKRQGIAAVGASSVDEQARGEKRKAEEEAKL